MKENVVARGVISLFLVASIKNCVSLNSDVEDSAITRPKFEVYEQRFFFFTNRITYDVATSYDCNCSPCSCGKGCTTTCCQTCYTYYDYCAAGTYHEDGIIASGSSCDSCPAGQYQDNVGSTSCLQCPSGRYEPNTGSTSCDSCAAGKSSSSSGATAETTCEDCPAGEYSLAGASSCSYCSAGQYSSESVSSSCDSCPGGKYNSDAGSISCSICSSGQYAEAGDVACSNCSAGQYSSREESSSCGLCAAGKYSSDGSSSCMACAPGQYALAGYSLCLSCSPGTYSSRDGSTSCGDCPAGKYTSDTGSSSCSKCSPGQYALAGYSLCLSCSPGTYAKRDGSTSCGDCPEGQYSSATGSSSCLKCSPGQYASSASTSCSDCAIGQYATRSASSSCKDCAGGKYGTIAASSSKSNCKSCVAGQYSVPGASSCTFCEAGTYVKTSGSENCGDCPAGQYSTISGASSCSKCSAGYESAAGSTSCTKCGVGTYSPKMGTVCVECESGRYNSFEAQASCTQCIAGSYSSNAGAITESACLQCSSGKYSSSGSAYCQNCARGKFQNQTGQGFCTECDKGKYCSERGQNASVACRRCPVGSVCQKYGCTECSYCTTYPERCLGGSDCEEGYEGDYCNLCQDGWFLLNEKCLKCPGIGGFLIFIVIVGFIAVLLLFLAFQFLKTNDLKLSRVKMIINHYQLTTVSYAFHLSYPKVFLSIIQIIVKIVAFDFIELFGAECAIGSLTFTDRWLISEFSPIGLIFIFAFPYIWLKFFPTDDLLSTETRIAGLKTASVIASTTFIWGVFTTLEIWNCTQVEQGSSSSTYIETAQEIECKLGNPTYDLLIGLSIVFGLFYIIGIQSMFYWLVHFHEDEFAAINMNDLKNQIAGEFKDGYTFWFLLVNLLKLLSVIFLVFLAYSPLAQAIWMIIILLIALILTILNKPYKENFDLWAESAFRCIEILQLIIAILTYQEQINDIIATIFLFLLSLISCYLSLRIAFQVVGEFQVQFDDENVVEVQPQNVNPRNNNLYVLEDGPDNRVMARRGTSLDQPNQKIREIQMTDIKSKMKPASMVGTFSFDSRCSSDSDPETTPNSNSKIPKEWDKKGSQV